MVAVEEVQELVREPADEAARFVLRPPNHLRVPEAIEAERRHDVVREIVLTDLPQDTTRFGEPRDPGEAALHLRRCRSKKGYLSSSSPPPPPPDIAAPTAAKSAARMNSFGRTWAVISCHKKPDRVFGSVATSQSSVIP